MRLWPPFSARLQPIQIEIWPAAWTVEGDAAIGVALQPEFKPMQISAFPGMSSMQAMHQRMFQQADADGDGGLTLDEFKSIGKNAPAGAAKPADA